MSNFSMSRRDNVERANENVVRVVEREGQSVERR